MKKDQILFLDIETDYNGKHIYEIGVLCGEKSHKDSSPKGIASFLQLCPSVRFICGHNLLEHDLEKIHEQSRLARELEQFIPIDTLPVSLLFFNERTHHALPKPYKSDDRFINDPVKDCELTKILLNKILERFSKLPDNYRSLLSSLLRKEEKFRGFFDYIESLESLPSLWSDSEIHAWILENYEKVTDRDILWEMIEKNRVELAYILALMTPQIEIKAHPPKVLYDYPNIVEKQRQLCYDAEKLKQELERISNEVFGISSFRTFPKLNPSLLESKSLSQRQIVEAALHRNSFLAILPTGGGKTFTFWLPAVIHASRYKALTVVISPLQALIEDHIKNFERKVANYRAVAISGFLTTQERADAIEQVINGEADILYIAPESLRSNTIFSILKNRYIERFVVDEAHCLSTWGNDFRQDYYYICSFIEDLLKEKPFQDHIPVSCFTATAKQDVIDDIKEYFREGLGLELEELLAKPERKNLVYRALNAPSRQKYTKLLRLVTEHEGASLVYIPTSTRLCDETAERLAQDTGKSVRSFHSKLDPQEKMEILKRYIHNEIDVIVATTAFGMGVDKPDITQVIHYEASESLENYAQEAGRGARDERLAAQCAILYDESDLDKHFHALRRNKITVEEINAVFRVIKRDKRDRLSLSAKELAAAAGWDVEDEENDFETKIKTILLELEREGYISRKRNIVRFFGDSVATDSRDRLEKLLDDRKVPKEDRWKYVEVLNRIIGRGNDQSIEVDDIAYILGIGRDQVASILQEFIDANIVGDSKDLRAEIRDKSGVKLQRILQIEEALVKHLSIRIGNRVTIKELNELLIQQGIIEGNESETIRNLVTGWRSRNLFRFQRINRQQDLWEFRFEDSNRFGALIKKRRRLVRALFDALRHRLNNKMDKNSVDFSYRELREELEEQFSTKEIDRGLLFLHRHGAIRLIGGRFIYYNPMTIEKLDKIKIINKRYTKQDYKQRLGPHYTAKTEAIHIMGKYASQLLNDPKKAITFLSNYFTLKTRDFIRKYKLKKSIDYPITQGKMEEIFGKLNDEQKTIIEDRRSRAVMILAGPGSGKTRVLVHKIASLILTEDVKPEQFMMLTFSRSAVREFRSRLYQLIGEATYEMEISTFHSFALKLIGRTVEKNGEVLHRAIDEAVRQIREGKILLPQRTALVLDEYQDIGRDAFDLVLAIAEMLPEMRIIAVGDDDQCIMEFSGASIEFFERFRKRFQVEESDGDALPYREYALLRNYRSIPAIVYYAETFIEGVSNRLKNRPLIPHRRGEKRVDVIHCRGGSLLEPAIDKALELLSQTQELAILARTNEEVLALYSELRSRNVAARFLIDRKRFEMRYVEEIAVFDESLQTMLKNGAAFDKELIEMVLNETRHIYRGSKNLPLLERAVYGFLDASETLSPSFWIQWLEELELEALETSNVRVTVSTIHKSKGMEFDAVVLLAPHTLQSDEERRLYYVGMTRAKNSLTLLHRGDRSFLLAGGHARYDTLNVRSDGSVGRSILLLMDLSDIVLSFDGAQNRGLLLKGGDPLEFRPSQTGSNDLLYFMGKPVGMLSKNFQQKLNDYKAQGYRIISITVDFVVRWRDRERGRDLKHVLGKIELIKDLSTSS